MKITIATKYFLGHQKKLIDGNKGIVCKYIVKLDKNLISSEAKQYLNCKTKARDGKEKY